jgi:hypothetical protein
VSSGTLPGFEDSGFDSVNGWRSSENKTGVYAGRRFSQPNTLIAFRIMNKTNASIIDF